MYNNADGPGYCVGTEAYGLEMTIDDEWPVDTVILCPPRYVAGMSDVKSMGVHIGASHFPGNQDLRALRNAGATWILAYPEDPIKKAASEGLSILLVIESIDGVPDYLGLLPEDSNRFAIALQTNGLETPAKFEKKASTIRKQLDSKGLGEARILACGWFDLDRFRQFFAKKNVDGVLMLDADSGNMIELIAAAVGIEYH
jgi:hypothetical protein